MPVRKTDGSAGYDLFAALDLTIPAKGRALIPTGVAVKVPDGTYGRVAARSGLASKHLLDVGAGVIDPDYTGPITVGMFNHSVTPYKVHVGDSVAQLV